MINPSLLAAEDKEVLLEYIQQLVPPNSGEPQEFMTRELLKFSTNKLIQAYLNKGDLQQNPYTEARKRRIYRYDSQIKKQLEGKTILVTGGEGCIGNFLIKELLSFDVRRVVSIDKVQSNKFLKPKINQKKNRIGQHVADIRDFEALKLVFEAEKPDIVFHLAAQRQPGLAEIEIRETISTNIFGTYNIIQLCEDYDAEQCIFSSTGKASRYFTSDIYAGSKKIAEYLFAQATKQGRVKYGMVRFTHVIENSIISEKIDQGIERGIVKLHAPDLYIFAQNSSEAVNLLLNAVIFSDDNALKFLVVRDLGGVVSILELALFKIFQSGREVPLYFEGIRSGYNEPHFPGQVEPKDQIKSNVLVNVIESSLATTDWTEDMLVKELASFSLDVLDTNLSVLRTCLEDKDFPEIELKKVLAFTVKSAARSIFINTCPIKLLKILKLGVNPKFLELEEISIDAYKDVVEILVQGLYGRLTEEIFRSAELTPADFNKIIEVLSTLPAIQNEVVYLQSFSNNLSLDA